MKLKEAYLCKICGKIHHHKLDTYCKQCGAKISYPNPHHSTTITPPYRFATENLEPVIIRRIIFGWDVRPVVFR